MSSVRPLGYRSGRRRLSIRAGFMGPRRVPRPTVGRTVEQYGTENARTACDVARALRIPKRLASTLLIAEPGTTSRSGICLPPRRPSRARHQRDRGREQQGRACQPGPECSLAVALAPVDVLHREGERSSCALAVRAVLEAVDDIARGWPRRAQLATAVLSIATAASKLRMSSPRPLAKAEQRAPARRGSTTSASRTCASTSPRACPVGPRSPPRDARSVERPVGTHHPSRPR